MTDLCICCGEPATRLCDETIGMEIIGFVRDGHPSRNQFYGVFGVDASGASGRIFTCDAPLCDTCTTKTGNLFVCGSMKSGAGHETLDRCPADHPKSQPMFEGDAEQIRRDIHATLRRSRMVSTAIKGDKHQ